MDAITVLTTDHREVVSLFKEFESSTSPDIRKELVDSMSKELSTHSGIEELHFYPKIKDKIPEGKQLIEESLHEHQQVKEVLAKLERMSPEEPTYASEVHSLIADVKHHVEEEEGAVFPKVRAAFSSGELMKMGEELEKAKPSAPTHPHPMAPAKGVAAKVAGVSAGMMDHARDAMGGRKDEQAVREDVMEERSQQHRT